jgi:4-hydroxybenzoate polyprenyltransferase
MRVSLTGDRTRIFTVAICVPAILLSLAGSTHVQALIFLLIAVGSLIYMMPLSINGNGLKGLRNWLFTKNIVLSLIWTIATVVFPLSGDFLSIFSNEVIFLFLRHFFFIYALTVVFDIRDISSDKKSGFKTIALMLGEQKTRLFALFSILVFVLLTIFDQNLSNPITIALLLSALFTTIIICLSGKNSPFTYFTFLVDGSMVVQFILVLFASMLW